MKNKNKRKKKEKKCHIIKTRKPKRERLCITLHILKICFCLL